MSLLFEGIIWFLMPTALVIINDIMAYLAGLPLPTCVLSVSAGLVTINGIVACLASPKGAPYWVCLGPPARPPTPHRTCTLLAGFFFGRTPLIKLSPKKTWEGFLGGCVGTGALLRLDCATCVEGFLGGCVDITWRCGVVMAASP